MTLHEFPAIPKVSSGGGTVTVVCGINFNDTTQSAKFDINFEEADGGKRRHGVSLGNIKQIQDKQRLLLNRLEPKTIFFVFYDCYLYLFQPRQLVKCCAHWQCLKLASMLSAGSFEV